MAASLPAADSSYISRLPTGERWLQHMNQDLLPFWTTPAALGSPLGNFPSTRCDDGSLINYSMPCTPIGSSSYLMTPSQYLVTLCWQTYGFGVVYHLTGDSLYLQYMKAGVDHIRQYFFDPAGGMFTSRNINTGVMGPARETRNTQELGYSLLGMAFYYYLTRDATVVPDMARMNDYIFTNYFNPSLGAIQWQLSGSSALQKHLVGDLDQMNTYMVLTTPLLPEPYQTQWKQRLAMDARSILGVYYSPMDNLIFLQADTARQRDLAYTTIDVGHTAKALWMIRYAGQITGDKGMENFAASRVPSLFERVYIPEADGSGSWGGGIQVGGALDKNKNWWVYCELDQLAGAMGATADVELGRFLPQTTDYWFRYFVDHEEGEVWNGVNYPDNTPQKTLPKAFQWKNMYHDFEHVLMGYITSQWLHGEPATLHFAFQQPVDRSVIHPYYLRSEIDSITTTQNGGGMAFQKVVFRAPQPVTKPSLVATSAASYLPGPLAAGSFASAWGAQLATNLAQTAVTVTDSVGVTRAATASYASPTQVNFRVPPESSAGAATITVQPTGGTATTLPAEIAAVSPGIFQLNATGLAAAVLVRVKANQTQTVEDVYQLGAGGAVQPRAISFGAATDNLYLSLFGTGLTNARSVAATVAGQSVPVLYSGPQGTFAGLDQINVGPLPRTLVGMGKFTVVVAADGQTANPVELTVQY